MTRAVYVFSPNASRTDDCSPTTCAFVSTTSGRTKETGAPSLARLNRHDRRKRLRDNVLKRRWCRWRCSHPPVDVGRRASGREIHERVTCRDRCGTRPRGAITVGLTLATRPTGCPTAPCVRQRRTRLQRSGRGRRRVRIQPGGRLRPRRPEGNRGQPEAQQKADQEEEYTATSGPGRVLVRGARLHRSRVARPEKSASTDLYALRHLAAAREAVPNRPGRRIHGCGAFGSIFISGNRRRSFR